jgi:hypothetical protein
MYVDITQNSANDRGKLEQALRQLYLNRRVVSAARANTPERSELGMGIGNLMNSGNTHIDRHCISFCETTHLTLGEEAIGEERKKHKLGQSQKLVSGKRKAGAPGRNTSATVLQSPCTRVWRVSPYRRSIVMVSSAPTSAQVVSHSSSEASMDRYPAYLR